jgi:hypothetical protein
LGLLLSPEAVAAHKAGDVVATKKLLGQKCAGLALGYAAYLPVFGDALMAYAESVGADRLNADDMRKYAPSKEQVRKFGDEATNIRLAYDALRSRHNKEEQLSLVDRFYPGASEGVYEFLRDPIRSEEAWDHVRFCRRVPKNLRTA